MSFFPCQALSCLLALTASATAAPAPEAPATPAPAALDVTTKNVFKDYWADLIGLSLKDIAANQMNTVPFGGGAAANAIANAAGSVGMQATPSPFKAAWPQFVSPSLGGVGLGGVGAPGMLPAMPMGIPFATKLNAVKK